MKPSTAHPDLAPLLEKHGLSWEQFSRKGRLPKDLRWVAEKRRAIITEMHSAGTPWSRMIEVTGLSLGAIERGTSAAWNEASRKNRSDNAAAVGRSRRGEKKPWLTLRLKQTWDAGGFNHLRGRVRPPEELLRMKLAANRPEVRAAKVALMCSLWQQPEYRARLLAYHRSETVRRERSEQQSLRLKADPVKWTRGRGAWLSTSKGPSRLWVRSSYEQQAIALLENDPNVLSYEYEPRFVSGGRHFVPDFLVRYKTGVVLIEVKSRWVLGLPENHSIVCRLRVARDYALSEGWEFQIWSERELYGQPIPK